MPDKILPLVTPFDLHGKTITCIKIKEPSGGLFFDHGPPTMRAQMRDGTIFAVDDKEAIKAYIDRCVTDDHGNTGLVLVKLMGLDDAIAVRSALVGFFYGGTDTSPPKPSDESSTPSSST